MFYISLLLFLTFSVFGESQEITAEMLRAKEEAFHSLSARGELGFRLVEIAKKHLKKGERVSINVGNGYSIVVAKVPLHRVSTLAYGPFELSQKEKKLEKKIRRKTKEIHLWLKGNEAKEAFKVPNEQFRYPPYAIYLAKDALTQKEKLLLTTFTLNGQEYYLDFDRMQQVQQSKYVRRPIYFGP